MVPTPRSYTASSSRNGKPWLEIIPDTRFIVFHGSEHEAQNVQLTGVVRLHTPEPMSILKPKIRLEGKRRISWYYSSSIAVSNETVDKRVFWNQEQRLGVESAHKVKAGTIEWPFEFELSPSMPESVEGLRDTYIVYNLYASVARPGWNAKDIFAQEHIRLVRTLGQENMETSRSRVNADIWANKLSYSISIPTDAIVFGTSIIADVELSPIRKGIRLGKVELRLMEIIVKRIQASDAPDIRGDRTKTDELEVQKTEIDFPEDSRIVYDDETVDNPTLADEMYKFKATLKLPKSLNLCRQDVDTHSIHISHRFKLMVNIHNPEGHVSQLVCRLPVKLFISPNLPVDEHNRVHPGSNGVSDEQLNSTETAVQAPPEYGRHQLDQMYSDIDPTGFLSRAGSVTGTPAGLMAQSRRGSSENILSINGVADADMTASHGSAMPSLLHSRLADLQESGPSNGNRSQGISRNNSASGGTSPGPAALSSLPNETSSSAPETATRSHMSSSYFPIHPQSTSYSPHGSASMSRRTSGEHNDPGVQARDYDLDNLSRVPSYGAAIRTPGAFTPFTEGPPSYLDATSRPASPGIGVQRPAQAHIGSGHSSPRSNGSAATLTASLANLRVSSAATSSSSSSSSQQQLSNIAPLRATHDDETRLRMLRART